MGPAYLGMPDGMPGLHQVHSPGVQVVPKLVASGVL